MEMMTVLPKDGKEKDLINIQPLETVSPGFLISKFYSLKIQPSIALLKVKGKTHRPESASLQPVGVTLEKSQGGVEC